MAQCLTPYTVKIDNLSKYDMERRVAVPCGHCPNCVARRTSQWSFRLMQEDKTASSSYFITLTYTTESVPLTEKTFMTLKKEDFQNFMKRLRKLHPKNSNIKYYACGEYGGKTLRPHYHAIIFNADINMLDRAWTLDNKMLGYTHFGTVTEASVGYCLKYMCKKGKIPMHKNDDRIPEFSLMSKGLGKSYITEEMVKWHHMSLQERMYCTTRDGKKLSMPRYYKERIYDELELKAIAYHITKAMDEELEEYEKENMYYHTDKFQSDMRSFSNMEIKSNNHQNNKI